MIKSAKFISMVSKYLEDEEGLKIKEITFETISITDEINITIKGIETRKFEHRRKKDANKINIK